MANTIAWQRSTWQLVEARTIQIPYFHGNLIRMPYVLLRNRLTGREAWFYNSHNPADAHGPNGLGPVDCDAPSGKVQRCPFFVRDTLCTEIVRKVRCARGRRTEP